MVTPSNPLKTHMAVIRLLVAAALIFVGNRAFAAPKEHLPEGAKVTALEVTPNEIALANQYAYAQVLVTAQLADGSRIDATRMVEPVASGNLVEVSPTLVVRPKADGDSQLAFHLGGQTVTVPVTQVLEERLLLFTRQEFVIARDRMEQDLRVATVQVGAGQEVGADHL